MGLKKQIQDVIFRGDPQSVIWRSDATVLSPKSKIYSRKDCDVIFLRKLYDAQTRLSNREIWEAEFKDRLKFSYFRNLWQGTNWSYVMPEVFTEENKKYYLSKNSSSENKNATFSDEEVIIIRKRYVKEGAKAIHKDYEKRISFRGMEAVLRGQNYKHLPYYKKREKRWVE
jgi:hypothetical protein